MLFLSSEYLVESILNLKMYISMSAKNSCQWLITKKHIRANVAQNQTIANCKK